MYSFMLKKITLDKGGASEALFRMRKSKCFLFNNELFSLLLQIHFDITTLNKMAKNFAYNYFRYYKIVKKIIQLYQYINRI